MIGGYRISQAIFVAVKLGIADRLKDEPRSHDELAASAGVDPHALYRLLMVLVEAGADQDVTSGVCGRCIWSARRSSLRR